MQVPDSDLEPGRFTILLPTLDRPQMLRSLLGCYAANGISERILVCDSSAEAVRRENRDWCHAEKRLNIEYVEYPDHFYVVDKVAHALRLVTTEFVALCSDDDVMLPHALRACASHLAGDPDCAAAYGYYCNSIRWENHWDITGVGWFTPSLEKGPPLERMYDFMRRYQTLYWAMFRTAIVRRYAEQVAKFTGPMFQELMWGNLTVLSGKVARLPIIYAVRGSTPSSTPLARSHPLYWFIRSPSEFFARYAQYRSLLVEAYRRMQPVPPPAAKVADTVDVIHACYFATAMDPGPINYQAQAMMGLVPPLDFSLAPVLPGPTPIEPADRIVPSRRPDAGGFDYILRDSFINAEPRDEISIGQPEIDLVLSELDTYV